MENFLGQAGLANHARERARLDIVTHAMSRDDDLLNFAVDDAAIDGVRSCAMPMQYEAMCFEDFNKAPKLHAGQAMGN